MPESIAHRTTSRRDGWAVQVVGTNHKQTRVETRERIAADGDSCSELLEQARVTLAADELALLRTCNRVEIYYYGPTGRGHRRAAMALLSEAIDSDEPLPLDQVYHHSGEEAIVHLFEVAAGLDSMVLGEHEILGQVKTAVPEARARGFGGPTLTRLFSHAARVGKRARRETAISSGIFSVGQCGARMAQDVLGDLQGRHILVFGAGRIAKVTAKHLAALGAKFITVFSRTYDRACDLADLVGAKAITADDLMATLRESDVIVGCASAPHHVITTEHIREAMEGREERPLVVIDLGVPRNVDPAISRLRNVHLFNIDDLEVVVAQHAGEREQEVARVRAIVRDEVAALQQKAEEAKLKHIIAELRGRAEVARQECLKLACRKQCSEEESELVNYVTDLLVRKLLHRPIAVMREAAAGEDAGETDIVAAARRLFGLGDEAGVGGETTAHEAEEDVPKAAATKSVQT